MEEELSLKEKVDLIFDASYNKKKGKIKKLKIPRKSRVNKRRMKKNWIGILKIDENGNISGEKQQIEDSSYRLSDGTYHSTNGSEILRWQGKFPLVIQSVKRKNPINLMEEKNETYGQKYIMARMLKDAIKIKNKGGNIIIWILLVIGVVYGINYFLTGGSI